MVRWLEHCNYCIRKAIEEGSLDEEVGFVEDHPSIKDFKPAYPVYDNHNIYVFHACEKCEKKQKEKYDPVIFNDYSGYEEKVKESGERFDEE